MPEHQVRVLALSRRRRQASRTCGRKLVIPMRRLSLSAALLPLVFALVCAAGQAATLVRLHADHIAFYYDRFLVEADGHVQIQTSDGFSVSGDAFSMDLKLNRFLIAGHVTLKTASDTVNGAAVADFLDFNRLYFVPVTSEPDRWTFLNDDLAHPVKGRVMPGDVFYFPDLTGNPSLTASSATISERTYVHFGGAVGGSRRRPGPARHLRRQLRAESVFRTELAFRRQLRCDDQRRRQQQRAHGGPRAVRRNELRPISRLRAAPRGATRVRRLFVQPGDQGAAVLEPPALRLDRQAISVPDVHAVLRRRSV